MSKHTHHVKHPRAKRPLFTAEQQREMRRLGRQGYASSIVASQLKLPRDAVAIWMRENGVSGHGTGQRPAPPVTLPKLKCLEGE